MIRFLAAPLALGIGTAAYNFARFHSVFDFGYARIPGAVAQEPWYSRRAVLAQRDPVERPENVAGGDAEHSIDSPTFVLSHLVLDFLASPFLFLLFREGGRYRNICWIAIGALTLFLWCHGNPGGWQFSYRYGMVLLPWMFLLLLGNGPHKISTTELSLFLASIAINAVAVQQFLWINEIKP